MRGRTARIEAMTTKERLHKLVDGLSVAKESEAAKVLAKLQVDAAAENLEERPEMVSAPKSWGWDKTAWGAPMPNVVAWVDQSRQGR
jgi:hypothetical protein